MKQISIFYKPAALLMFLVCHLYLHAQDYLITKPLSWDHDHQIPAPLIIETPDFSEWERTLDNKYYAIQEQDSIITRGHPPFVAIDHEIVIPESQGYSFITENNEYIRIFRLQFPDLEKIQLLSTDFYIPENAKLFIYTPGNTRLIKSFDSGKNTPTGNFNTGPIHFNDIIIEYNEKLSSDGYSKGRVDFDHVSLFFKHNFNAGSSLPCHNNVNCNPWRDDLCQEIRSAVKLQIRTMVVEGPNAGARGWVLCSGGLVNNSNFNLRPIILSARHCVTDFSDDDGNEWVVVEPENWIAYYNFQSPVCDPTTMGNDRMFTTGMQELGSHWCSDLLTLEVTDNAGLFPRIPIQYNYFMNAWHTLGLNDGTTVFGVHHPRGDLKKVSEGEKRTSLVPCFWNVRFNNGIVERGSSGSPLVDNSHFTIGTLSFSFTQEDDCDVSNYYYGALKNANRDVLSPLDNNEEDLVAIWGIDPVEACLNHIDIYGDLFPGASWLAAQNQITIQAANTISVAPLQIQTIISNFPSIAGQFGVQPSPPTSSDYVFLAGQSITFFPGFSINNPALGRGTTNVLSARIGDCLGFEGCGFNYANKKGRPMTYIESILQSDSIIRVQGNYGGTKYFLKQSSAESINLQKTGKLTLYPNPATGILEIVYTESFTYQVMDIFGTIITSGKVAQGHKANLNVSSFVPGIYFIKAETGGHYEIRKFLKQ